MAITYVKSSFRTTTTTDAVEINLGLGVDEAARILAIELYGSVDVANGVNVAISFDPEDTLSNRNDDEQFCFLEHKVVEVAAGELVCCREAFFNFVGMNLITARNLALILASADLTTEVCGACVVFYEKIDRN